MICTVLKAAMASRWLYTQKLYLVKLRYAISKYNAVEVREAERNSTRDVIHDNSFSSMIDVRLSSQLSSDFYLWLSVKVSVKSRQIASALLSK